MLDNRWNRLQLRELLVIKSLFALGHGVDRHPQTLHLIEVGNDLAHRFAAPNIEESLVVVALPFGQGFLPSFVMKGHGVGKCAITVEKVGTEITCGDLDFHVLSPAGPLPATGSRIWFTLPWLPQLPAQGSLLHPASSVPSQAHR